jgi:hypothetical protein
MSKVTRFLSIHPVRSSGVLGTETHSFPAPLYYLVDARFADTERFGECA